MNKKVDNNHYSITVCPFCKKEVYEGETQCPNYNTYFDYKSSYYSYY